MTIEELNQLSVGEKQNLLLTICGSMRWVEKTMQALPTSSLNEFISESENIWLNLQEQDWLQAFAQHPQIGESKKKLESFKCSSWSEKEQSAVQKQSPQEEEELSLFNKEYLKKFGFIFIIFASGKSAPEILEQLKTRLKNERHEELNNAVQEQNKINKLRLKKLFNSNDL